MRRMKGLTDRYEEHTSGTTSVIRAAPAAKVRLQCTNPRPCGQGTFRAAEPMRCPRCQHATIVLGVA